jgi:shikimate kinase
MAQAGFKPVPTKMDSQKNIYLTGFMGAGKSSIGKLLAKKLHASFTDTDKLIERALEMKISDVFKEKGEAFFREEEAKIIAELAQKQQLIVSLGGGAILREENRKIFSQGIWIFLNTPFDVLKKRSLQSGKRPLAQTSPEEFEKLYKSRLPLYNQASFIVDTAELNKDQVCDGLIAKILFHV